MGGEELAIKVEVRENEITIHEIEAKSLTVKELFERLQLIPNEYVVVKNGEVITEEDKVVDGDTVILYPVKSGG